MRNNTNSITLEVSPGWVENLVERLPLEEKLRLVRKLEKETLKKRWDNLLKIIDQRLKRHPISKQEIHKEIERARKEHYAKRCN